MASRTSEWGCVGGGWLPFNGIGWALVRRPFRLNSARGVLVESWGIPVVGWLLYGVGNRFGRRPGVGRVRVMPEVTRCGRWTSSRGGGGLPAGRGVIDGGGRPDLRGRWLTGRGGSRSIGRRAAVSREVWAGGGGTGHPAQRPVHQRNVSDRVLGRRRVGCRLRWCWQSRWCWRLRGGLLRHRRRGSVFLAGWRGAGHPGVEGVVVELAQSPGVSLGEAPSAVALVFATELVTLGGMVAGGGPVAHCGQFGCGE